MMVTAFISRCSPISIAYWSRGRRLRKQRAW